MSVYPARNPDRKEHTRRGTFAQAGLLAVVLFVISSTLTLADPGNAAVNIVPTGGKHRGIVLKSQTVDAALGEAEGKVWADTKVWLRLQNPASKPITVSVSLPGPQIAPVPLPFSLDARVDNKPLTLVPVPAPAEGQSPGLSAAIGIPARGSVNVNLSFRQELPEDHGIVTFAYPLSGADQWAGNPESLRVTVKMDSPVSPRALLHTSPAPHRSDEQSLTWDWETEWSKSKTDVGIVFMSPGWFAEFEAARMAALGEDASAATHLALSQHYQRLASLPPLEFVDQTAFRTQYYSAAIAELQAAVPSSASPGERAQAHAILASLYVQQADEAEPSDRKHFLQAADTEIQLALDASAPEAPVVELAGKIFTRLLQEADAGGDRAGVEAYRDRLEGIRSSGSASAEQEASTGDNLSQASRAVEMGDIAAARAALVAQFGPTFAESASPIVSQTTLTVSTGLQGRTIALLLGRGENLSQASKLAERIEAAVRLQPPVQAIAKANMVTITLPEPPGPPMLEMQQSLASDLPDVPEIALLGAVLADANVSVDTETGFLRSTRTYTERADLSKAQSRWTELADQLDARPRAQRQVTPMTQSGQLSQIQQSITAADARAWRSFAANSGVIYRFDERQADTGREWQLAPGETRDMSFQISHWNLDNLRWLAIAVCVALLGAAALVWYLA